MYTVEWVNLLNEKCEAQLAELNALKPKVKEEKAQRIEKDKELKAMIRELNRLLSGSVFVENGDILLEKMRSRRVLSCIV
ncbi:MAG: hypothetical protein ACLTS6_03435 [Anaerobutyricum sp.]